MVTPLSLALGGPPRSLPRTQGELAFELLNLNSVPASVLDPRPMQLQHYVKRLQVRSQMAGG